MSTPSELSSEMSERASRELDADRRDALRFKQRRRSTQAAVPPRAGVVARTEEFPLPWTCQREVSGAVPLRGSVVEGGGVKRSQRREEGRGKRIAAPDQIERQDACGSRIRRQAATGSWTRFLQWETQWTWFRSAGAIGCPPAKVNGG